MIVTYNMIVFAFAKKPLFKEIWHEGKSMDVTAMQWAISQETNLVQILISGGTITLFVHSAILYS